MSKDSAGPWTDMPLPEVYSGAQPNPPTNDKKPLKENNVSQLLFSFLEGTTAHGLPKVVSSQSWPRRLCWLVVFLGAFSVFVYQMTHLFQTYYEYPVAVKIEIVNRQTVNFPAVTVCNLNMMKSSMVEVDNKYKDLVTIDRRAQLEINNKLSEAGYTAMKKRKKRSYQNENDDKDISKWSHRKKRHNQIFKSVVKNHLDPEISSHRKKLMLEHWLLYMNKLRSSKPSRKRKPIAKEQHVKNSPSKDIEMHYPDSLSNQFEAGDDGSSSNMQYLEDENLQPMLGNTTLQRERRALDEDIGSGEVDNEEEYEDQYSYMDDEIWNDEDDNLHEEMEAEIEDMMDEVMSDDEFMEDDFMNEFRMEDNGFMGRVHNDYEFKKFMRASRTSDYSDLVDVLKPSQEELDNYGHQALDLIKQCSFDKANCSYLDFHKVYNPYYGLCYVFNHGTDNTSVRQTSSFGSRYGLRLTLDIEYDEYLGLFSHKSGARITVHPHDITSFPQDFGVSAAPGMETEIGVSLETVSRQPYPYTSNCTNGAGYNLSYEGNYSITACSMTCVQRELASRCRCVDKLVTDSAVPRCEITNRTQEACRQMVYYLNDNSRLGCDCPTACSDYNYRTYTSSSKWPSDPYKYLLAASLIDNDNAFLVDNLVERIHTSLVRIHVYLDDPTTVSIEEYPSYPWDRLLADIGGLLGLFIGVSACTAVELVEFFVDAGFVAVRTCARRQDKQGRRQKQVALAPKTVGAPSHPGPAQPGLTLGRHPEGLGVVTNAWAEDTHSTI